GLILNAVPGPEVEIRAAAALPVGIRIQSNNAKVRGLAIHGFGANSGEGGIVIDPGISGTLIEDNVLGRRQRHSAILGQPSAVMAVFTQMQASVEQSATIWSAITMSGASRFSAGPAAG